MSHKATHPNANLNPNWCTQHCKDLALANVSLQNLESELRSTKIFLDLRTDKLASVNTLLYEMQSQADKSAELSLPSQEVNSLGMEEWLVAGKQLVEVTG
jgi:hypothetical protein